MKTLTITLFFRLVLVASDLLFQLFAALVCMIKFGFERHNLCFTKRINKRKSSKSDTLKTFGFVVEAENELFGFDLVLFELGNLLVLLCDPRLELLCLSR